MSSKASHDVGWIGLGRMGEAMAARLLKAGHAVSVWNRTASKADPLAALGAEVVTDKAAMAHCATVFTMLSTTDDLKEVLFAQGGVLLGNARPTRIVDMSSISDSGSAEVRKSHVSGATPRYSDARSPRGGGTMPEFMGHGDHMPQRLFIEVRLLHQPVRHAAQQIKMRAAALIAARPQPDVIA